MCHPGKQWTESLVLQTILTKPVLVNKTEWFAYSAVKSRMTVVTNCFTESAV